ncbi:AP2-associated protein kinase 1 [Pelomyxa schiedti]|nr:AP2-associated protein kinase 1 [Pelomyxa schiedti]
MQIDPGRWLESLKTTIGTTNIASVSAKAIGDLTEKTKELGLQGLAATRQGINSLQGLAENVRVQNPVLPTVVYQLQDGRRLRVKKVLSTAGRYGEIYLTEDVDAPQRLSVVKVMALHSGNIQAVKNEMAMMKLASGHKNVIAFEGYCNSAHSEAVLAIEYCSGGSLLDYLNERLHNPPRASEVMQIFLNMCEGLAHIHSKGIIHRDIKIENLLLHSSGNWKIGDFGSATQQIMLATTESQRGVFSADIDANTTMAYRAPEMVDLYRNQAISSKADVWAVGCALYKMLFLVDAFDQGKLQILNCKYSFPKFHNHPQPIVDLIPFILNPDPDRRPSINDVIQRVASVLSIPCPVLSAQNTQTPQVHSEEPVIVTTGGTTTVKNNQPTASVLDSLWIDDGNDRSSNTTPSPPNEPVHHSPPPQPRVQQTQPQQGWASFEAFSNTSPSPSTELQSASPKPKDMLVWDDDFGKSPSTSPANVPTGNSLQRAKSPLASAENTPKTSTSSDFWSMEKSTSGSSSPQVSTPTPPLSRSPILPPPSASPKPSPSPTPASTTPSNAATSTPPASESVFDLLGLNKPAPSPSSLLPTNQPKRDLLDWD